MYDLINGNYSVKETSELKTIVQKGITIIRVIRKRAIGACPLAHLGRIFTAKVVPVVAFILDFVTGFRASDRRISRRKRRRISGTGKTRCIVLASRQRRRAAFDQVSELVSLAGFKKIFFAAPVQIPLAESRGLATDLDSLMSVLNIFVIFYIPTSFLFCVPEREL